MMVNIWKIYGQYMEVCSQASLKNCTTLRHWNARLTDCQLHVSEKITTAAGSSRKNQDDDSCFFSGGQGNWAEVGKTHTILFAVVETTKTHSWLVYAKKHPGLSKKCRFHLDFFPSWASKEWLLIILTTSDACGPWNNISTTWRIIPLSKWVITPLITGISRVNPLPTGVITHLASGMNHQVPIWIMILHGYTLHPKPDGRKL